jgi:aspartyl aminopeptidase
LPPPLIPSLLEFLQQSPTPFHAVRNMQRELRAAGFIHLREGDRWALAAGDRYYVVRNGSSVIAFATSGGSAPDAGLRLIGAHTDSPCLKPKPQPEMVRNGYLQLGVEVYGGALLNPWFDRDLSLAGRVTFVNRNGDIVQALVDFRRPIGMIPSLAIHLDRDVNNNRSIDAQKHLPAIVMLHTGDDKPDLRSQLLRHLQHEQPEADAERVLDYDLSFYDVAPPQLLGMDREFIAGARLDNLVSCYLGLRALIDSGAEQPSVLVCNDHEEVGSMSAAGARGPFLRSVLERWLGAGEKLARVIDRSLLLSVDNAHGVHPNYSDRHDENHGPVLNRGPVIKVNANQSYATSGETAAIFRHLCSRAEVPLQSFVVRTDMACGSTIGPLTAGELGVRTLDVGIPQLAMHSVRELCGVSDAEHLHRALLAFVRQTGLSVNEVGMEEGA